jgi:uncharacterized membrane protein YhaH (DUF805 family)
MTFGDSVRTCFSKYLTIEGRASRSEYWWFYLLVMGVSSISQIGAQGDMTLITIAGGLVSLVLIIPSITVAIRRMHDHDRSGWWLFLGLIPLIGALVILYWFVIRGTVGDNQFGADPLG